MTEVQPYTIRGGTLLVRNPDKSSAFEFDFGRLGLPATLTNALIRAFVALYGHTSTDAQRAAWTSVNHLGRALAELETSELTPLVADALERVRKHLGSRGLSATSAQTNLVRIRRLLGWCSRNETSLLAKKFVLTVKGFERTKPNPKRQLTQEDQKAILTACYREIDLVEQRLSHLTLSERSTDTSNSSTVSALAREVLGSHTLLPTRAQLQSANGALFRKVANAGGLRALAEHLWVTPSAVLPFYIAVLLQTGGNPTSIWKLETNCIEPHSLREDIEWVVWEKKRARREQRADFPTGREWSAPSIVRRLNALNANLRPLCVNTSEAKRVFICLKPSRRGAGALCIQSLHNLLAEFIERNALPHFTFRDLRRSVAVAHHVAGGTIKAAQLRLNHRDTTTTRHYTELGDRAREHEVIIHKFQGLLVRSARGMSDQQESAKARPKAKRPSQTVFGFECADPFSGIADKGFQGRLCTHFQRCATCPGAIVTLDQPKVVARLLAAQKELSVTKERALREGWHDRYLQVYEPTRRILSEELVPAVSQSVMRAAVAIADQRLIPYLE